MDKDMFVKLCMIQFVCWRLHPGYANRRIDKEDLISFLKLSEELWALLQQE